MSRPPRPTHPGKNVCIRDGPQTPPLAPGRRFYSSGCKQASRSSRPGRPYSTCKAASFLLTPELTSSISRAGGGLLKS